MLVSPSVTPFQRFQQGVEWLVQQLKPWRWLWPPMAFCAGLGSFFLVDRQQWLGAILALGLLLTWVLLLLESMIRRFLVRRGHSSLPQGITAFISQMVHQETLFFTLPFVLVTTVWSSGQVVFTLMVAGMALLSILDPLYFRLAGRFRSLYFIFHAHCVFLVVLVTLPIMFQLSTGLSLKLALLAMVTVTLPTFLQLLRHRSTLQGLMLFCLTLLLAGGAWMGRIWVPPTGLWLTASALSPSLDVEQREPQGSIVLTPENLSENGLYVYSAIRAPRGLRETITHEWRHENEVIDRVELNIAGGREQGYRAWSHKQNFPEAPEGEWRVDIMTNSGQRIGLVRFTIANDPQKASVADSQIKRTGLSRLNLKHFVPGQSLLVDD